MRGLLQLAAVIPLLCLSGAAGPPGADPRVLVITDDGSVAATHSRLLSSLSAKGYELEVHSAKDAAAADVALHRKGDAKSSYRFGSVLLLCPTSAALSKKLPIADLERFIDAGGNVFFTSAPGYSSYVKNLAKLIGVDLDAPRARVIDHVNFHPDLDQGERTFVKAGGLADSPYMFGAVQPAAGSVVFTGPGASLNVDNELIVPAIWGSGSSFTYAPNTPVTGNPHESGTATIMSASLPARSGSRVTFFGSFDVLSDAVFDAAGASHESALTSLVAWTFGHTGVLRTRNMRYRTDRPGAEEDGYRVKDDITFSIDIQAWDGDRKSWVAFAADDVQLEFVMLNPWVRVRLRAVGNGDVSTYSAVVPVPDQIGIYKFLISYHRAGVSALEFSHVLPIRPFLHNEYRRFIPMAYPYYAACFMMMVSVFLLGLALNFGGASVLTLSQVDTAAGVAPVHTAVKKERSGGLRQRKRD